MNFPPQVERWRPLVARYFPPHLVDKALWVIMYESGGNPNAIGDGGNAIGLFQIHHAGSIPGRPDSRTLLDPETNIRYAAQNLGAASGNWAAWGENNLYQGKPFGALGHHPFPGDTRAPLPPGQRAAAKTQSAVSSLFSTLFGAGSRELENKYPYTFRFTKTGAAMVPANPEQPPPIPASQEEKKKAPKALQQAYEEERRHLEEAIAAIDAMLMNAGDNPGLKASLLKEREYYTNKLRNLHQNALKLQHASSAVTTLLGSLFGSTAGASPPPQPGQTWQPWNPKTQAEYQQLLFEFQQAFQPYLNAIRKYYPEITWNQLAAMLIGSGGQPSMLPPEMQYLAEPPLDEKTGKPVKGFTKPGIYLVTASGNVQLVMDEQMARSYFDLADQFQTAVGTFGPYFDSQLDPETAAALAQFSPEMLAWQDAADRYAHEKALVEAAEALADKEGMAWRTVQDMTGEHMAKRNEQAYRYGTAAGMPYVVGPPILPSREKRLEDWKTRLSELLPLPPSRPVPNIPGIPGSTPPRVPGWEDRPDPIKRLGADYGVVPSQPF